MANQLKKVEGQKYVVSLRDEANPTDYDRILILNTNVSAKSQLNLEEVELPDLDDFDAPYYIDRTVKSHDYTLEGSGKVDPRYIGDLHDYHIGSKAGDVMYLKIQLVAPTGMGGYTITGPFYMDNISENGEYKTVADCQLSFKKAGALTYLKGTVS
jgi:hypothetical protein